MEAATPRDWQQQWRTEISIYYKCNEMRELDEYLGDIHGFIVDREVELVSEMLDQIVQAEDVLIHTCEVLAELDVLLAFADAAKTGKRRVSLKPWEVVLDLSARFITPRFLDPTHGHRQQRDPHRRGASSSR